MDKNAKQEPQGMYITPEQLQDILRTAIAEASKMNPLETRKYQEEIDREQRRNMLRATISAEVRESNKRKFTCSHSRYPNGHKMAGMACPKGQGEWTTGGQTHGRDVICIVCLRCGDGWSYRATPQEVDYALDAGLLGYPPPPPERVAAYKLELQAQEEELKKAAESDLAAMAS